jgi:hypothetical protein
MANCAVNGCYKFVDRDGLIGFCKEHKENAVLFGVERVEAQLAQQKKLIERLERDQRDILAQLRRRG